MDDIDREHSREVRAAVQRALTTGCSTFEEVLQVVNGADPHDVQRELSELEASATTHPANDNAALARRESANLPNLLPAPDPMWSQWWFTLDTVVSLAECTWHFCAGGSAAFLGAPTVGFHFKKRYGLDTTILDADSDVVRCLAKNCDAAVREYDVYDSMPMELRGKHAVALIDPPWYPEPTQVFLARARELLADTGFVLCVLPSRLTRPGLVVERTHLLTLLLESHFEVVGLESQFVHYRVPPFEAQAYTGVEQFIGRPWRKGDLLILRTGAESRLNPPNVGRRATQQVFSRDPSRLRYFLAKDRVQPTLHHWVERVPEFEEQVSTRRVSIDEIALWSTGKRGARIRDVAVAEAVLDAWAKSKEEAHLIEQLKHMGHSEEDGRLISQEFSAFLSPEDVPPPNLRRAPAELRTHRDHYLTAIAAQPTQRQHDFHNDQFRLEFQRDRDRVLWSHSLSRLANKTQVFPVQSDDQLRRRLRHCIEVMQLASTIAVSFGLDRDLTEAGALVHDVGHCPFGHAGEHALDRILNEIDEQFGGFNHYEHGLDVVRWLENIYSSPAAGGFPGLNLTSETTECIIKHTYHLRGHRLAQTTLMSESKHQDLDKRLCHLEGQAVRIADKISYLISDLEDGIRMGVFELDHLYSCKLFDRAPIDLAPEGNESIYERFIAQRRAILKVLMEDVLSASDQRLTGIRTLEDVRNTTDYIIDYSPEIKKEVSEIWTKLQAGILHKNERVVAANLRAARITSDLLLLYAIAPNLVEPRFRKSHQRLQDSVYLKWYLDRLGEEVGIARNMLSRYLYDYVIGTAPRRQGDNWMIHTKYLVQAKDYVASLTDTRAEREHRRHIGNQER